MRRDLLTVLLAILIGALIAPGPALAKKKTSEPVEVAKRALIINLTSGPSDIQSVSMGLGLAAHGVADGRQVTVFLNVAAPVIASDAFPANLGFVDGKPIKAALEQLIADGATVLVCPHCLANAGLTEADLIEGVALASRESLFGAMDDGAAGFSY
jgi:predicted peroxiredoxin